MFDMLKKYVLITLTRDGMTHRHYYDSYEALDCDAVYCQFSRNIIKAKGMMKTLCTWKSLFTIG